MTTDVKTDKIITSSQSKDKNHDVKEMTIFGFWIYLMTDCILFCCLFATYIVLMNNTAGGPTGKEIFNLTSVLTETILLLSSSITYGMSVIAMEKKNDKHVIFWMLLTYLFGTGFIGMEVYELSHLIENGLGPDRSGFLSAFFALVGSHGLHVIFGLIWMVILICQIFMRGLTNTNCTRVICLSLFWHFLDIIWICVFSVVYLIGVI